MMSGSQSYLHVFSRWCGRWCRQMATDPEGLKSESCAVTKGHVMGVGIPQNEGGQLPRGQLGGYLSMGKKAVTSHTCHQQALLQQLHLQIFAICTRVTTSSRLYPFVLVFYGVSVVKCKLRLETLVLELLVSYSGALQQNQGCGTQIWRVSSLDFDLCASSFATTIYNCRQLPSLSLYMLS